ncbi:metallophosphoesterase [Myroides sp. NP-2]|uniref:metallophosphoesterase family protein n=1 Tax=Myroides sp. NP-2 TaxID=2759945 RepID=UPI0015F9ED80|nr:metallophosphoesterase [Myroides sp. NP-2]MBB1150218.1 metallophosphoesterase [Myroides sp. NP-2]
MKRSDFLRTMALGTLATAIPFDMQAKGTEKPKAADTLSFGIITDLHQDLTFDAPDRLQAFVDEMNRKQVDFIVQLGDFCVPKKENKIIVDIWNSFQGDAYHVIGNHEFDENKSLEQIMDFFELTKNYYSFDRKGYHFVVLDANGKIPGNDSVRYPSYFHKEQLEWLEHDLKTTPLPTIVFIHQGLDHNGVHNREAVRILFDNCNKQAGFTKVKVVFSGHHHMDYANVINGIQYVQINSAVYRWLGEPYNNQSFPQEAYKKYPYLRNMGYYKEPLWAHVEIESDELILTGKESPWFGDSPVELGEPIVSWNYVSAAKISDRLIKL